VAFDPTQPRVGLRFALEALELVPARRFCTAAAITLLCAGVSGAELDLASLDTKLNQIARRTRAGVGVTLIHVESGARLSIRGGQPFPMASVYKLPIALEFLTQVADGTLTLDRQVTLRPSDIRACCTLSRRHPRGGVTLGAHELLELMIIESDNTSGDALMKMVGGPAAVERRMSAWGFKAIRVNRYGGDIAFEMVGVTHPPPADEWTLEMQYRLISEVPSADVQAARARYIRDPRDTATPDDMAALLVRLQRGSLLPRPFTQLLLDLMARAKTGPQRLKGRLPPDTIVAHKTGTTDVVMNDVGLITLPAGGGHLAMAVFTTNGARPTATQNAIAEMAAAAYEAFTGKPLPPPEKPKSRAVKSALNNGARKRANRAGRQPPAARDVIGRSTSLPRSAR
jgi:beta-lactamase class A